MQMSADGFIIKEVFYAGTDLRHSENSHLPTITNEWYLLKIE